MHTVSNEYSFFTSLILHDGLKSFHIEEAVIIHFHEMCVVTRSIGAWQNLCIAGIFVEIEMQVVLNCLLHENGGI